METGSANEGSSEQAKTVYGLRDFAPGKEEVLRHI